MLVLYGWHTLNRCIDSLCLSDEESFNLVSLLTHWFQTVEDSHHVIEVLGNSFKPILGVSRIVYEDCRDENLDNQIKDLIEFYQARILLS